MALIRLSKGFTKGLFKLSYNFNEVLIKASI